MIMSAFEALKHNAPCLAPENWTAFREVKNIRRKEMNELSGEGLVVRVQGIEFLVSITRRQS